MDKLIHCHDAQTRDLLISKGCKLLKDDKVNNIYILLNNLTHECYESLPKNIRLSNKMTF